jgi:hypothetical protein
MRRDGPGRSSARGSRDRRRRSSPVHCPLALAIIRRLSTRSRRSTPRLSLGRGQGASSPRPKR